MAIATKFPSATNGDADIATVTPATVKIRPVKVSCPMSMKTATKLFIWANSLLRPMDDLIVVAIIFTFCSLTLFHQ
jgi:hypothetical protein